MGVRDWLERQPKGQLVGTDGRVVLYGDRLVYHPVASGKEKVTAPLGEVESVTLEEGAALERRITATRLVAVGVFALAWKKARGGESFFVVEGPGVFFSVEVPRKKIGEAAKFLQRVREAVAKAS